MSRPTFPRFRTHAVIASLLLVATVVVQSPPASAATWLPPTLQRIIGGPSLPGLSAWGLAYNPVTGEMLVGDYVANQVRRFSLAGTYLGDFSNPKGNVGGVGSALAVDPRDGSTYLAVTGDGKTSKSVRKYDVHGNFMYDFNLSGSVTWLTIDNQGRLWTPEAFGGTRIRRVVDQRRDQECDLGPDVRKRRDRTRKARAAERHSGRR